MTTAGTTTYTVETVYTVTDKASRGLDDIDKHAKSAAHSTETLSGVLKGIGAAVVGGSGIAVAKHAFIDFNREVQDAKISLSAMLQGNYDSTWGQATKGANDLYNEFQRFSQLTPVTTQEMLEFGRGIAVSTAQAGGSVKDIIKVTEQGVVAAKALGAGGAYASLEISEMLQGNVSNRMRFVKQLLGMAHTDEEHFKKLDAKHRLELVEKVLNSDAMKNATDAFSTSFSGVLSTLEDKVQITLGRAGQSLFGKVTQEMQRWSQWLDANSEKIDHIVESVGEHLVSGFQTVKDLVAWIVDHSDTLLAIGKVWAGSKIAGALAGGLQGSIGGIIGAVNGVGKAATLGSVAGSAGSLATIGTAAFLAGTELAKLAGTTNGLLDLLDPQALKYKKLVDSMSSWDEALTASKRGMQGEGKTGATATDVYAKGLAVSETILPQKIAQLESQMKMAVDRMIPDMVRFHPGTSMDQARRLAEQAYNRDNPERAEMLDKARNERNTLRERIDLSAASTERGVDAVMATLTQAQKANIDTQRATETVMREMDKAIAATGFGLSMDKMRELILGDQSKLDKDPFAQGRPSNTNIHIDRVEVAAKDPDRWIQDLDAAAKRRLNGPRGSRNPVRGR